MTIVAEKIDIIIYPRYRRRPEWLDLLQDQHVNVGNDLFYRMGPIDDEAIVKVALLSRI